MTDSPTRVGSAVNGKRKAESGKSRPSCGYQSVLRWTLLWWTLLRWLKTRGKGVRKTSKRTCSPPSTSTAGQLRARPAESPSKRRKMKIKKKWVSERVFDRKVKVKPKLAPKPWVLLSTCHCHRHPGFLQRAYHRSTGPRPLLYKYTLISLDISINRYGSEYHRYCHIHSASLITRAPPTHPFRPPNTRAPAIFRVALFFHLE